MADRTKSDRSSVEVTPAVRRQLTEYQTALQREINRRATHSEIISALLWGVPLWQTNAMLNSQWIHGESMDED